MIAAWMLYAVVVSGLLAVAAAAGARALTLTGRPRRTAWAVHIGAAVTLPLTALLPGLTIGARGASFGEAPIVFLEPLQVSVSDASIMHALDRPLLGIWIVVTSALLIRGALLAGRLVRWSQRWEAATFHGRTVRYSRNVGPAVAGFLRPQIVVPRWLKADPASLDLVFAHEDEHVRAKDAQLLAVAALLVASMPWNPFLWWSLRRLRLATEIDCDARVLARFPMRIREYCELLLAVGARRGVALPTPALSEPPTLLERRIDTMTRAPRSRSRRHLSMLGAVVLLGLGTACFYPGPDGSDADPLAVAAQAVDLKSSLADGPRFTPFTTRPELQNVEGARTALEDEYPPLLRDAGIGGTVNIWFFIAPTGDVLETRVQKSSGHAPLDDAALRVAETMRFSPARNGDEAVYVWVAFPITFVPE